MTTTKRINVYVARAYGYDTPIGGWSNFFFTKQEAKEYVNRYIKAGIIDKGWIETVIYEQ